MEVDDGNDCMVRARGPNGWVEVHVCLDVNDQTTRRRAFNAALNGLFAAVDTKSAEAIKQELAYGVELQKRIDEVMRTRKKLTRRRAAHK